MLKRRTVTAAPDRQVSALEFLGAQLLPDLSGWWVYALGDARDGRIFYVGQSDVLLSRLRDQFYAYRERWDPRRVWLVKVADQAEADLTELLLIRQYEPECNTLGTTADLEKRLRAQNRPTALRRRGLASSLDSGQATD
jgi:hypothetical protein